MYVLSSALRAPWELIQLQKISDDRQTSGPFLCEAFAMSRWLDGTPPHLYLPLRRMAIVAPEFERPKSAVEEMEYLESQRRPGREVQPIEANGRALQEALASGEYDGWHFAGHGQAADLDPNCAGFRLDDYQVFTPEVLSGEAANLGRQHPLVFLNGCHTGRGGYSLTRMGGWAQQFLDAGAGAFVGTWWAIEDHRASKFVRKFYESFFAGRPIAEVVREARLAIRDTSDPTWLAYTLYAHPQASCEESPHGGSEVTTGQR